MSELFTLQCLQFLRFEKLKLNFKNEQELIYIKYNRYQIKCLITNS